MEMDFEFTIEILESMANYKNPYLMTYHRNREENWAIDFVLEHNPGTQDLNTDPTAQFVERLSYHLELLADEGLVIVFLNGSDRYPRVVNATRMTAAGHRFLNEMRAAGAKDHVTTTLADKGLRFTIDTAAQIARAFIQTQLGL